VSTTQQSSKQWTDSQCLLLPTCKCSRNSDCFDAAYYAADGEEYADYTPIGDDDSTGEIVYGSCAAFNGFFAGKCCNAAKAADTDVCKLCPSGFNDAAL
jgi:hypothetical protein